MNTRNKTLEEVAAWIKTQRNDIPACGHEFEAPILAMRDREKRFGVYLTDWFPPETKPADTGIYEVKLVNGTYLDSYWDGSLWYRESDRKLWHNQKLPWRGLSENPWGLAVRGAVLKRPVTEINSGPKTVKPDEYLEGITQKLTLKEFGGLFGKSRVQGGNKSSG